MTTLRELIVKAETDLDVFKNPDVWEVRERLNEILTAGGRGMIAEEYLSSLRFSDGILCIYTEYSNGEDVYEIPGHVIDSDDPLKAMKLWAAKGKVAEFEKRMKEAERVAESHRQQMVSALAALSALTGD
jgi:hypothetical protein